MGSAVFHPESCGEADSSGVDGLVGTVGLSGWAGRAVRH